MWPREAGCASPEHSCGAQCLREPGAQSHREMSSCPALHLPCPPSTLNKYLFDF